MDYENKINRYYGSCLRHFNIILTISYLNAWGKQMENACLTYIN